ncbi:hypothetical protein OQY15_20360 [Pedobacter sp. MC2016-15]|jgi:hypothetical protein|uniref:hypothetical protein n=1 Tax=Pedobacter sp. MC2016-15 TaxID=2994473 RepID=UPI0022459FDE|nr:hypothetical protein [Pedobacter sp. MC2016-15]MCX2481464.1 hypothetical protein [Pedobacter sp. MC2016-15]
MTQKDDDLKELLRDIDKAVVRAPRRRVIKSFKLNSDPVLLSNLSGWLGAFTVRAMLRQLKIDEHHIFKWRPENKFVQYLLFSHYVPGCMPLTLGLSRMLKQDQWVPRIRKLIGSGFFIKATLGFGSGRTKSFDRTSEIEHILNEHEEQSAGNEKWIIQKKLKLKKEFRVHSFGQDVLYGMTLMISGQAEKGDFDGTQEFVELMLEKLPASLLEGTLIGWDIALTHRGKYYVIEANFTGFHPQYHAGFQTSGYFEESFCGPILCALLNAYFKNKYDLAITTVDHNLVTKAPYMEELSYYLSIFKENHILALQQGKGTVAALYIYLGEKTDFLMIKLISYMQVAQFAHLYYIISPKELQPDAEKMFRGNQIRHLTEHMLFPADEYAHVLKLEENGRKQACLQKASELIREEPCLML